MHEIVRFEATKDDDGDIDKLHLSLRREVIEGFRGHFDVIKEVSVVISNRRQINESRIESIGRNANPNGSLVMIKEDEVLSVCLETQIPKPTSSVCIIVSGTEGMRNETAILE